MRSNRGEKGNIRGKGKYNVYNTKIKCQCSIKEWMAVNPKRVGHQLYQRNGSVGGYGSVDAVERGSGWRSRHGRNRYPNPFCYLDLYCPWGQTGNNF